MPMDAEKLNAFANGGPKPAPADMMEDDPDAQEGGETEEARDFSALLGVLTEYSDDLEACCDELDPEALTDLNMPLEETDKMILEEGLQNFDRAVQKELDAVMPLTPEEADQIAGELEGAGAIDDAQRVSGYLQRLTALKSGGGEEDPEGGDEEDNPDDEEYDEYD